MARLLISRESQTTGRGADLGLYCRKQKKGQFMNKRLMLLVAGTLAALAFTALPGAASAKETKLDCESDATNCTFTVAGGASTFSAKPSGDTVRCTSVSGSGGVLNPANGGATTITVSLKFHGCVEKNSGFEFICTTPGQPNGTIVPTANTVGHIVDLPGTTNGNGVLLTDNKATFTCAGVFARTTVTGNVIGESEEKCGGPASTFQKVNFEVPSHGNQKINTWTGKTFNLLGMTNHPTTPTVGGTYETAAQSGTGTLTWNQNVRVTCAE
jgi:hypothetical protein